MFILQLEVIRQQTGQLWGDIDSSGICIVPSFKLMVIQKLRFRIWLTLTLWLLLIIVNSNLSIGSTVHALAFPSRRLFGNRSNYIAHERKRMLQTYLNTLIQTCASLQPCPLAKSLSKKSLIDFSSFFEDDIIDNQVKDSIPNSPRSDNSE